MTPSEKKEPKKYASKFKAISPVIQICPDCGKVDVVKGHEKECEGAARWERIEHDLD